MKKTFGLKAWCMGERERNGRGSVVLVCESLQQIRRSCGRSETLSLDVVVMNILACFRSWAYRHSSAFGNFMTFASF